MKLSHITAALLIASSLSAPALAASKATEDFLTKATIGNKFEIAASDMALARSEDKEVREFAKAMVEDHKENLDMLSRVAPSDADPRNGDKLDAKHQAELDKLQKTSDEQFDSAYIAVQQKAHAETVALYSSYAQNGDAKDLKDFAAASLPTLKMHQQHVGSFKKTSDGWEVTQSTKTPVSKSMDKHPSPMAVERSTH